MGRLRIATFTGVDDHTDLDRLERILERYRFAEAGVLVSLKRSGVNPRFPSLELLPKLCKLPKRLSVHICDELARNCVADPSAVLRNLITMFHADSWLLHLHPDDIWPDAPPFQRVQVNVGVKPQHWPSQYDLKVASEHVLGHISFIIQVYSFAHPLAFDAQKSTEFIDFLHDRSGGRGAYRNETFDSPGALKFGGFAGGITPANVDATIKHILTLGDDFDFWVDAETGVRDANNRLDLGAVEEYLAACEPYFLYDV